jgi:urocanate hydratase
VERIKSAREERAPVSIGFLGNVVDVWERLAALAEAAPDAPLLVDLGSDQTSLHNPWAGGYCPAGLTLEESKAMMVQDPAQFKERVQASLRRQVAAINRLAARGLRFWDYGNAFLKESAAAGAEIREAADGAGAGAGADGDSITFRYPSYVQDIMGDIFSLGFGPFRWVCTSGSHADLMETDRIAAEVMEQQKKNAPPRVAAQLEDNLMWIRAAEDNALVVGSEARILYADCEGRTAIALAFNEAVASGRLSAPVVLSRDHHDVSGTDSPFRETSNVTDGSHFCADMAVQNFVGDAIQGATWVALHNGGGCGWGEVMNGGFGMLLDGGEAAARRARNMLLWDVNNGISRRAWGRNANAEFAIRREMERTPRLRVTLPNHVAGGVLSGALDVALGK